MKYILNIILFFISIPARLKGVKFGKNSFINYGYDFVTPQLKNIFIGDNYLVAKRAWIQTINNGKIEIGNNTNVGRNVTISSNKSIKIGDNCLLSYNVSLLDHNHVFKNNISPIYSGTTDGIRIAIGDNSFIGAHSFIMPGVIFWGNYIVGANSVIVKSFNDCSVIAGSPIN